MHSFQIDSYVFVVDPERVQSAQAESGISIEEMIRRFSDKFGAEHVAAGNRAVAEKLYPEYAEEPTLAVLRLRAGLSQRELANRMGAKQPFVARLESSPSNITFETMQRLASALDVDLKTIVGAVEKTQLESAKDA